MHRECSRDAAGAEHRGRHQRRGKTAKPRQDGKKRRKGPRKEERQYSAESQKAGSFTDAKDLAAPTAVITGAASTTCSEFHAWYLLGLW